jgi:TfoX/Sxy family transcriptional regulator of competence genes
VEWEKSPEALAETFHQALPVDPRIVRRKMFGNPGAFVGGNLFASLHGSTVVVRLPDAARAELLSEPNTKLFEPMAGRPMREYVVIPAEMVENQIELRYWLEQAFDYANEMPEKEKKPVKAKPQSA